MEFDEIAKRLWRNETVFALATTLLFLCLGTIGIAHHEMWRDEMQAWLIARDSTSVGNLLHNMRYEGHPVLWHLGLYALTRFTHNPIAMQIYHLLLAAGVIFLFARFAPFPRYLKAMFSLGYFPFYEYALISRNYAIGILLLFAICALFPMRAKRCWPIALLLFLLSNTNAYALMIAVALLAAIVLDYWIAPGRSFLAKARPCDVAVSLGICIAGFVVSALQIIPPHDVSMAIKVAPAQSSLIHDSALAFVRSYIPIPHRFHGFPTQFWQSNLLMDSFLADSPFLASVGAGLFACSVLGVSKSRLGISWFLIGTSEMLLFAHFIYPASLHHLGHIFMLFLACLWLAQSELNVFLAAKAVPDEHLKIADFRRNVRQFVAFLFLCQAVAGVYAYIIDYKYPFSGARQTAAMITTRGLSHQLMIAGPDFLASPLCGYLDCKMYYPQSESVGSFIIWNNRRKAISQRAFMLRADAIVRRRKVDALLILARPLAVVAPEAQYIGRSRQAMMTQETYCLYELPYRSVIRADALAAHSLVDNKFGLSRSARSGYGGRTVGL